MSDKEGTTHSPESEADEAAEPQAHRAEFGRRVGLGLLEAIIPDLIKKVVAQGAGALADEKLRDSIVSDVVRKAIDKGNEVVDSTEDHVRRVLSEMPLPKEAIDRITERLDDYKAELFRVVSAEVRAFLESIDLGHELQKMLTSLSFEISTEIRFVPNERSVTALKKKTDDVVVKGEAKTAIKPDVKSRVRVKRQRRDESDS